MKKMGKEFTLTLTLTLASSLKLSKSIEKKLQQFNSLINVLKPKVYITNCFRFKKLVQELTGNASGSNASSSTSTCCHSTNPSLSPPAEKVVVPIIDIEEHTNFNFSNDDLLSFDSLEQYYSNDQTYSNTLDESLNLAWEANMSFGNMCQPENLFLEPTVGTEWSGYRDLESWLVDTDQHQFQYGYGNDMNQMIGAHETEFNLDDICSWLV